MQVWVVAAIGLFGLLIGSFLNVVIHRVPRNESLVSPGSRCTTCGHELTWFENVPVIAWIALRARCRVGYRDARIVELARLFRASRARGGLDQARARASLSGEAGGPLCLGVLNVFERGEA